jgi:histidine triad (HIT) family protein
MKRFFLVLITLLCLAAFWIDFPKKSQSSDCPFCQESVLKNQMFAENDLAYGILTRKPALPGHVLVIPKRHVERYEELSSEEMLALGEMIKRVHCIVKKRFGKDDYALIEKNGPLAGQSVPHVHFHYLPGAQFLALRFLIAPWLPPLSQEEMMEQKKQYECI